MAAPLWFGLGAAAGWLTRRPQPQLPPPACPPQRPVLSHLPEWAWVSTGADEPKYAVYAMQQRGDRMSLHVDEERTSDGEIGYAGEGYLNQRTGHVELTDWQGTTPSARIVRRIQRLIVRA